MTSSRPDADFNNSEDIFRVAGVIVHKHHVESVTSTMDVVRDLTGKGAPPWTIVSAEHQTAGRGTKGRSWFSPSGKGLWLSMILPPPDRLDLVANVTLLAAEALKKSLADHCGIVCTIKHPNDLLVDGRKIAGIMVESITDGSRPRCLVLGMGLNLTGTRGDYDSAGLDEATTVVLAGGTVPDTDDLITAFLEHFVSEYINTTEIVPDLGDRGIQSV